MKLERYNSDKVPAAVGPYVHGIRCGNMIMTSGQIPEDAVTGEMITDIKAATLTVLTNLLAVVEECGGSKATVARVDVYVKSMDDFDAINDVYAEFFGEYKPTRVLVEAKYIAGDALLEAAMTAFTAD